MYENIINPTFQCCSGLEKHLKKCMHSRCISESACKHVQIFINMCSSIKPFKSTSLLLAYCKGTTDQNRNMQINAGGR